MFKKLDKYIIKSFLGPFVAILLIVIFALLMQFLWLYIDELVGKGLSLKIILEFLGWGAATMLPLSLPLATVLSSMMTMGAMAENSELIAIKSAGVSTARVMAPLIVTCAILAVGAFFAANNLVPLSYNKIYTLREDILRTKEEIKIPTKTFYDGIDGYVLRVESKNKKTWMMYGVMVYNHTSGKGNVSMAMADSAMIQMSKDHSCLTFAMYSGINYEESNSQNWRDTTRQMQRTSFTRQELIIPIENYGFQKSKEGRYSSQAKAMRLKDLRYDQDSIGVQLAQTRSQQLEQLQRNTMLRYRHQIDSAWIAGATTDFPLDSIGPHLSLRENIAAHESAVNNLNSFMSTMLSYDRETAIPAFTLKLIDIEIYKKFALALVCFLMFFVGAPLGALIRKGGLGSPAIVSVLFFVFYYVVDIVSTKLARDGAIDPFSGAFIASYILAPICAFLTYKAIKDEPIIAKDKISMLLTKIKLRLLHLLGKTDIVYMGTPDFAVAPLKALLDAGYRVKAVVTVPDKPSGRGMQVNESAVKKFAISHGIPVLQPVKMKDPAFIEALKKIDADLFVVVAFRLLPREVYSLPRLGTFNLHAALLPQYRGAAPINWAVINGEKVTGVTSFLIDNGVDTGKIMIREQYKIKPTDTAADVHDALMELGSKVVLQTVDGLFEGHMDTRLQKSFIQGEEVLHKAPKLCKELCHIDWDDSGRHIVNLIRGLSDYPCAFTELVGADGKHTQVKIYSAQLLSREQADKLLDDAGVRPELPAPGTIVCDGKKILGIAARDSIVSITRLQMAGKKCMPVEDFLRGFRDASSYTVSHGTSRDFIAGVHQSEGSE